MQKKEKLFGIGQISNITGVNIQTIRRYDAKGILRGQRDETSKYRHFNLLELTLLIRTRMYRNYGFSLNEIIQLLDESPDENKRMFAQRAEAIEQEIRRQQLMLESTQKQMRYLEESKHLRDTCVRRERPEMLGIIYYNERTLLDDIGRRRVISQWINHTPFVLPMIQLSKGYFLGKTSGYRVGLCITKELAQEFALGNDPYSFEIPAAPCIYTMLDSMGLHGPIADEGAQPTYRIDTRALEHAITYLNKEQLDVKGDVFGSTFFSSRVGKELRHFSHLWIPI